MQHLELHADSMMETVTVRYICAYIVWMFRMELEPVLLGLGRQDQRVKTSYFRHVPLFCCLPHTSDQVAGRTPEDKSLF